MGHDRMGHDRDTDWTWEYGWGMTGWDMIGIRMGHNRIGHDRDTDGVIWMGHGRDTDGT